MNDMNEEIELFTPSEKEDMLLKERVKGRTPPHILPIPLRERVKHCLK